MEIEYLNDTDTIFWKMETDKDIKFMDEIQEESAYMLWEQRSVLIDKLLWEQRSVLI